MTDQRATRRLPARIEFKPQDCWVGAFWKSSGHLVDVWVCVIPMVPIHFWFLRRWKGGTEVHAGAHAYPRPPVADYERDERWELSPELLEAARRGRAWLNPKGPTT